MDKKLDHLDLYTNVTSMSKQKQKELAIFFAEGNEDLKEILLSVWSNGIETIACCAGHVDNNSRPYISFSVDRDISRLASIMEYLVNCKDIRIKYWQQLERKDNKKVSISIHFPYSKMNNFTTDDCTALFKIIRQALNSTLQPSSLTTNILNMRNLKFDIDKEEIKSTIGSDYNASICVTIDNKKYMLLITGVKGYKSHMFKDVSKTEINKVLTKLNKMAIK